MPACSRCLVRWSRVRHSARSAAQPSGLMRCCLRCRGRTSWEVVPTPVLPWTLKIRVTGLATLALLVSFWLPWYNSFGPISAAGLRIHGWLFIVVLNSIVLVLYALITVFGVGDLADHGPSVQGSAPRPSHGVNVVFFVLGFLLKPTGFSWSWGAFLAARPPPSWLFCLLEFPFSRPSADGDLYRRTPGWARRNEAAPCSPRPRPYD